MDLALLLVVNCKFDITSNNLVFYYQFNHKHFVHKRINL